MTRLCTIFVLLILYLHTCNGDYGPLVQYCNDENPDYKIRSKTQLANLKDMLAELVPRSIPTGYAISSFGTGQDKVYGLAQCRGDVDRSNCSSCIQDLGQKILPGCPDIVDSRIWYDYCFLSYNKDDFIGKVVTDNGVYFANRENVTNPKYFYHKLGNLMDRIKSEAVERKNGGFGKGKAKLSSNETLYALVQCTRDLAPKDCAKCIDIGAGIFHGFCDMSKGCRVFFGSCYIRYELFPFFFPLD